MQFYMTTNTKNYKIRKFAIRSVLVYMVNMKFIFCFLAKIALVRKVLKGFISIESNFRRNLSFRRAFMRTKITKFYVFFTFFYRNFFATIATFFNDTMRQVKELIFTATRTANCFCFSKSVGMYEEFFVANWTNKFAFIYEWSTRFFHNKHYHNKVKLCL